MRERAQTRGHIGIRPVGILGLAALVAVTAAQTGCSAARQTQSRMSVVAAENADLRQQTESLSATARQRQMEADRYLADLQEERARLAAAQRDAQQGRDALVALDQVRADNERYVNEMAALDREIERIRAMIAARPPVAPPTPAPDMVPQDSPHLQAFARDLEIQLARYDVQGLKVEQRTWRDGRRRIAIVLPDAFKPGKDTLADRPDAVRAVVNLGRLIASTYPNSRVYVEGHTDSDPIRVHKEWSSNEHLSQARAETVRKLLAGAGVPAGLIETAGLGAAQPLEQGTTPRAKSRNRRVEIYIEPSA